MIENLAHSIYTDTVKLTTGGTTSALYKVAAAHIDSLECSASELASPLKSVVTNLVATSTSSRDRYFHPVDVDRVRIIRRSFPLGNLYLREGYGAITLDSVVIIRDRNHRILSEWNTPWEDVIVGQLNPAQEEALFLMIHELVHVRQYRKMGREQFINRYLGEALARGYANISTEQEAKSFEEWAEAEYDRAKGTWVAILLATISY